MTQWQGCAVLLLVFFMWGLTAVFLATWNMIAFHLNAKAAIL